MVNRPWFLFFMATAIQFAFNTSYAEKRSNMTMSNIQALSDAEVREIFSANMERRKQWLQNYFQGPPVEMQQFAFLLGEWATKQRAYDLEGNIINEASGHWRAKSLVGGRLIMDDFESTLPNGETFSGGTTLRTYSLETERWEMVYLTPLQANLIERFFAHYENGEIHGQAQGKDLEGVEIWAKIRFFNIQDNSFEWDQHFSWDAGQTWFKTMTISAKRQQN